MEDNIQDSKNDKDKMSRTRPKSVSFKLGNRKRPKTGDGKVKMVSKASGKSTSWLLARPNSSYDMYSRRSNTDNKIPKSASSSDVFNNSGTEVYHRNKSSRSNRKKSLDSLGKGDIRIKLHVSRLHLKNQDTETIENEDTNSLKCSQFYESILKDKGTYISKLNNHPYLEHFTIKKLELGSLLITGNCKNLFSLYNLKKRMVDGSLCNTFNDVLACEQLLGQLDIESVKIEADVNDEDVHCCREQLLLGDVISQKQNEENLFISRLDCTRHLQKLCTKLQCKRAEIDLKYSSLVPHITELFMVLKLTKPVTVKTFTTFQDVLTCQAYIQNSPSVGKSVQSYLLANFLTIVELIEKQVKCVLQEIKNMEPSLLKYIGKKEMTELLIAVEHVRILLLPEYCLCELESLADIPVSVMDSQLFEHVVNYIPCLIRGLNNINKELISLTQVVALEQDIRASDRYDKYGDVDYVNGERSASLTKTRQNHPGSHLRKHLQSNSQSQFFASSLESVSNSVERMSVNEMQVTKRTTDNTLTSRLQRINLNFDETSKSSEHETKGIWGGTRNQETAKNASKETVYSYQDKETTLAGTRKILIDDNLIGSDISHQRNDVVQNNANDEESSSVSTLFSESYESYYSDTHKLNGKGTWCLTGSSVQSLLNLSSSSTKSFIDSQNKPIRNEGSIKYLSTNRYQERPVSKTKDARPVKITEFSMSNFPVQRRVAKPVAEKKSLSEIQMFPINLSIYKNRRGRNTPSPGPSPHLSVDRLHFPIRPRSAFVKSQDSFRNVKSILLDTVLHGTSNSFNKGT